MPSNLYTREQLSIMARKGVNPFHTTSPSEALDLIDRKYGRGAKGFFYHRGRGNWCRWSGERDIRIKATKHEPKSGYTRELQKTDFRGKKY